MVLHRAPPASAAPHATRFEVEFVGFEIAVERRVTFTFDGQLFSQPEKDLVHAAHGNTVIFAAWVAVISSEKRCRRRRNLTSQIVANRKYRFIWAISAA